jgi:GT2 family glycosyltransferase
MRPPPGEVEVVVVDDGGSAPAAHHLPTIHGSPHVRLVRRRRSGGPAAARNDGAAAARGRLLAFTDDDCRPDPGWLYALVRALAVAPGAAVGGPALPGLPGNPWTQASAAIEDVVFTHENRDPDQAGFLTPKSLAVAAADFGAIGGFDPAFRVSEDRDFCDRWRAGGRRLVYVPQAVVHHDSPASARAFLRQHLAYGRGSRRFHAVRRRRGARGLRPDARFYARLLARPLSASGGLIGRVRLLALLLAAETATVTGYALEAGERHDPAGTSSTDGESPRASARLSRSERLSRVARAAR